MTGPAHQALRIAHRQERLNGRIMDRMARGALYPPSGRPKQPQRAVLRSSKETRFARRPFKGDRMIVAQIDRIADPIFRVADICWKCAEGPAAADRTRIGHRSSLEWIYRYLGIA